MVNGIPDIPEVVPVGEDSDNLVPMPVDLREVIPVDDVPVEVVPLELVPVDEVPVLVDPVDVMPVEVVPVLVDPVDAVPVEVVPVLVDPVDVVPVEVVPVVEVPVEVVPLELVPDDVVDDGRTKALVITVEQIFSRHHRIQIAKDLTRANDNGESVTSKA